MKPTATNIEPAENQITQSSLKSLAQEINTAVQAVGENAKITLEAAKVLGDKLIEAKSQVPHGQWTAWLAANCNVSPRQAQRYMSVSQDWARISKNDATSFLTITAATTKDNQDGKKRGPLTPAEQARFKRLEKSMRENEFQVHMHSIELGKILIEIKDEDEADFQEKYNELIATQGKEFVDNVMEYHAPGTDRERKAELITRNLELFWRQMLEQLNQSASPEDVVDLDRIFSRAR